MTLDYVEFDLSMERPTAQPSNADQFPSAESLLAKDSHFPFVLGRYDKDMFRSQGMSVTSKRTGETRYIRRLGGLASMINIGQGRVSPDGRKLLFVSFDFDWGRWPWKAPWLSRWQSSVYMADLDAE